MIQAGDLQAVVGDDSRDGVGGRQYAGLWSLTSKHRQFNAFGNSFAGLLPAELRGKGCRLLKGDETSATLAHEADDRWPSSARATYRVVGPHSIDHTMTIRDRKNLLTPHRYREVSWCCYMNSPEAPAIHFLSGGQWAEYVPPAHGVGSNIAPGYVRQDELEILPKQDAQRQPFYVDRIAKRFDQPFYFGRVGRMAFILMFDTPRWLRFFLSPSGGGESILPGRTCPAWDFLWVIPAAQYAVDRDYTFRVRLAYKPYVSDADAVEEHDRVVRELGFETIQNQK